MNSPLSRLRNELRTALRTLGDLCEDLAGLKSLEDFSEELETISRQLSQATLLVNRDLSKSNLVGDESEIADLRHDLVNHLYVVSEYAEEIGVDCEDPQARQLLDRAHTVARYLHHLIGARLRADRLGEEQPLTSDPENPVEAYSVPLPSTERIDRGPGAANLSGATLLLVDDDSDIRSLVSRQLARAAPSCRTLTASCGGEALRIVEENNIDLVLLDIDMPEMDGLEVLQAIRERYSMMRLPVVMSTGRTETEDVLRAFRTGANDYVTKPLNLEVVLARVGAQIALKRAQEELEKRNLFIRSTLGRFLTDRVVDKVLEDPSALKPEGEKRTVTVLMSDLRGFTSLSEILTPEKVVEMLNLYLTAMVAIIDQFGGTIDEIIGDAILVLFGSPIKKSDDAERAVACAIAMQRGMAGVNQQLLKKGLPEIQMGIGINTGEVVVGSIGSVDRSKYGVVGRHVNLAARIEGCTVGGQVLVSDATRQAIGCALETRSESRVDAKGFVAPILLHEVASLKGRFSSTLPKTEAQLLPLPHPIEVAFSVLHGKVAGCETYAGRILALSDSEGSVEMEPPAPAVLSNLRLHLAGPAADKEKGDFYGKVVSHSTESVGRFRLHFTDVPANLRTFFERIRERESMTS